MIFLNTGTHRQWLISRVEGRSQSTLFPFVLDDLVATDDMGRVIDALVGQRWVVRCTDAEPLARLNMVFVTVEPPGGSTRQTGKQFLRAYLQMDPNHP